MPTSNRSNQRNLPASLGQSSSHVTSQRHGAGRNALVAPGSHPKQTTLTQINFVQTLPPLDLDLECLDFAMPRRRKKRRIEEKPGSEQDVGARKEGQRSPTSAAEGIPGKFEALNPAEGPTARQEASRLSSMQLDITHTPTTRVDHQSLMPPPAQPQTPPTARVRTEVPSSQSPNATPLSIRSIRTIGEAQRSPLKERSTNILIVRSPSRSRKVPLLPATLKVKDTYELMSSEISEAERSQVQDDYQYQDESQALPILYLESPMKARALSTSQRSMTDTTREASLPVSEHAEQTPRAGRSLADSKDVRSPQARTLDRIASSSQPHFQAPITPVKTIAQPQDSHPMSRPNLQSHSQSDGVNVSPQVPSSQATTQVPTQFRTQPLPQAAPEVPSSQATTVVPPSSDPLSLPLPEQTPQFEEQKITAQRRQRYEPLSSPELGSIPVQVQTDFHWNGQELTESQLLPDSLLNWTIPMPPVLASQETLSSLPDRRDEDDIELVKIKEEPGADGRDGRRISPKRSKKSLTGARKCPQQVEKVVGVGRRKGTSDIATRRRTSGIKQEPGS